MGRFFQQKSVKIFLTIFLFILSIYAATFIHEVGHVVAFYSLGCDVPSIIVRIDITGGTGCLAPENWYGGITALEDLIATGSSLIFVSLLGLIFLIGFKSLKFVKKNYTLSIIFFSLAFNFLLNGFLQSLSGSDLYRLLGLGISRIYINLFAGLVGVLLVYTTLQFGHLLKRVEPKIKDKSLRLLSLLFWILVLLIIIVYLLLPYLF